MWEKDFIVGKKNNVYVVSFLFSLYIMNKVNDDVITF